jgi:hypothetical protein
MDQLHFVYNYLVLSYPEAEVIDNFILIRNSDPIDVSNLLLNIAHNLLLTEEGKNTEVRFLTNISSNITVRLPYHLIRDVEGEIVNISSVGYLLRSLGISLDDVATISQKEGTLFLINNTNIGPGWLRSYMSLKGYPSSISAVMYNNKLAIYLSK